VARIAVVIPCYNDGATVGDTVASVRSQENCELVVVNDGSKDEATLRKLAELEREGVRVVHQENRGLSAARMAGVAASEAPYVMPLDADDALEPGALTMLGDALEAHPEAAVAWGDTLVFGDVSRVDVHSARALDPWRITFFNGMPYSTMVRRTALADVGGWQLNGGYEDWDLWMALAEHGHTGVRVPLPTVRYRVHGSRMWRDAVSRHEAIVAVLEERHAKLFRERAANRRRSTDRLPVKVALPLIDAVPISFRGKRRLYLVVTQPRQALLMLRDRLSRARS
jgi:glycosyltransferase involved in cell wall biosynthesis